MQASLWRSARFSYKIRLGNMFIVQPLNGQQIEERKLASTLRTLTQVEAIGLKLKPNTGLCTWRCTLSKTNKHI